MFRENEVSLLKRFENIVVISPGENKLLPFWNIFVMLLAIFSSMAYGNFAVFRKDLQYDNYLEYLDSLSSDWLPMFYFSHEQITFFKHMELFMELVFFVVFIMQFFTEYEDM